MGGTEAAVALLLTIPSAKLLKNNLIYTAQRNVVLCALACLLYWCIYRICKYYKEIQKLEEIEKKYKEQQSSW